MNANSGSELREVFAGTAWQAGMIKSLLGNAGIEAFLKMKSWEL
jgi:hypothetical protein